MQRAPRHNAKPKSSPPPPAPDSSEGLGFLTCSEECSSDADARCIEGGSGWDDDDESCEGGGGGALQQMERTQEGQQQRPHVRGKHGKLKKMSTKYRHQEEGERELALRVRAQPSHLTFHA